VTAGRLDRLRETLEGPLLVSNLVNVRYLSGFESTNAVLVVDPAGPTKLITDFRYIEAAGAVPGVEAVLAKPPLVRDIGRRFSGTMWFEAAPSKTTRRSSRSAGRRGPPTARSRL
jgi:Xaa-Pro aminopeptidase